MPSAPTTCVELAALGGTADFTSREMGTLKQRCDLEDIQAKFAELDRNQDGYLSQKELPVEHTLSQAMARSDEQLAYYVAQAREVIDLSISSQQGIVEDLRRLHDRASAQAKGTTA